MMFFQISYFLTLLTSRWLIQYLSNLEEMKMSQSRLAKVPLFAALGAVVAGGAVYFFIHTFLGAAILGGLSLVLVAFSVVLGRKSDEEETPEEEVPAFQALANLSNQIEEKEAASEAPNKHELKVAKKRAKEDAKFQKQAEKEATSAKKAEEKAKKKGSYQEHRDILDEEENPLGKVFGAIPSEENNKKEDGEVKQTNPYFQENKENVHELDVGLLSDDNLSTLSSHPLFDMSNEEEPEWMKGAFDDKKFAFPYAESPVPIYTPSPNPEIPNLPKYYDSVSGSNGEGEKNQSPIEIKVDITSMPIVVPGIAPSTVQAEVLTQVEVPTPMPVPVPMPIPASSTPTFAMSSDDESDFSVTPKKEELELEKNNSLVLLEDESVPEEHVAEEQVDEEHVAEEHVAEEHVPEEHVPEEHVAEEHVAEEHVAEEHVAEEQVDEEHVAEVNILESEDKVSKKKKKKLSKKSIIPVEEFEKTEHRDYVTASSRYSPTGEDVFADFEEKAKMVIENSIYELKNFIDNIYSIEKAKFEAIIEEKENIILDKEEELNHTIDELNKLGEILDDTRSELNETKRELEDTLDELDSVNTELEATEGELDKANMEVESAKAELKTIEAKLDSTKVELDSAKVELDSNKVELNSTKVELDSTKVELDSAKVELDSTKVELKNANTEAEEAKSEANKFKVEIDSLNDELEGAKNKIESNVAYTLNIENELDYTKTELASANKNVIDLGVENDSIKTELESTKEYLKVAKDNLDEAQTKLYAHETSASDKAENELKSDSEGEVAETIKAELESTKNQLEASLAQTHEQVDSLDYFRTENVHLEKIISNLEAELSSLLKATDSVASASSTAEKVHIGSKLRDAKAEALKNGSQSELIKVLDDLITSTYDSKEE